MTPVERLHAAAARLQAALSVSLVVVLVAGLVGVGIH